MTQAPTERAILKVSGIDRQKFLQNLITNDISKLEHGLVYAALLTPQGKYISDFFLVPLGDAIGIDLHRDHIQDMLKRLTMYKLRAKVVIEQSELQVACGVGSPPAGAYNDPRLSSLGWRIYGHDIAHLHHDIDWRDICIKNAIPSFPSELNEDSYILEQGFERLNGVDFKKGCYVGQEVTARMKHKIELRKGLAIITADMPLTMGAKIENQEGREIGTISSVHGNTALGYVRFDRLCENMSSQGISILSISKPY